MRALLVAVLWAGTANQLMAAEFPCASIPNDLDRLACFDKQSGRTPVVGVTKPENSAWQIQTETSKLTDKKEIFLNVTSKATVSCNWNRESWVYLTIRCYEEKTSAILTSECHMVSSDYNDYGKVQYRVDDHPAKAISMQEATNNKGLGLWTGAKSIPFIKQLLGGHKMIVQFTPFGDSPVSAEFDITGLDLAIPDLRTQCKW